MVQVLRDDSVRNIQPELIMHPYFLNIKSRGNFFLFDVPQKKSWGVDVAAEL